MKLKHTGERMMPKFDKGKLFYYEHIARYLFASQFIKDKVVLDIACGEGYGCNLLIRNGAKNIVGIDKSQEVIDHAQNKYKDKKLKFICANAEKIPLPNNKFDIVVSFETIEHLKDQKKFLDEISRVLNPKGMIIISTPNKRVSKANNSYHTKELFPGELSKLISEKFKFIRIYYQDNAFANYVYSDDTFSAKYESGIATTSTEIKSKVTNMFKLKATNNLYTICVASNRKLSNIHNSLTIFDPTVPNMINEYIVLLDQKEKELSNIYNSRRWKIASFLYKMRSKIPIIRNL